jgi:predicted transglutaminase-like cysteine proteinase
MPSYRAALAALICLCVHTSTTGAQGLRPHAVKSPGYSAVSLPEFGTAKPPSGYTNLCVRDPSFCQPVAAETQRLLLSADRWSLISRVNNEVNGRIVPHTDEEIYGQLEYWTIPVTTGDCEDYVLLKRQQLMKLGIPEQSLLITVVQDEKGDGHAVLTVATTAGDMVLDNRRDEVLPWDETGYLFVKRQSAGNPGLWVSLERSGIPAMNVASGAP